MKCPSIVSGGKITTLPAAEYAQSLTNVKLQVLFPTLKRTSLFRMLVKNRQ